VNAVINIISGRVPGSSGTVTGFTGPTFSGFYSGSSGPQARFVSPGVSTGSFSSLVETNPVTKIPTTASQFFPTDIAVDFITGNAIYVSDERQGMIRRVIPGTAVSPSLSYAIVQTVYTKPVSDYYAQPRSIKYDTVNKLIYTSFTLTNEFYIYSTGLSTGYAVKGLREDRYLDVLGTDIVGNMYYIQYYPEVMLEDVNYIYKYNPITNTHTLLTGNTIIGENPSLGATLGTANRLNTMSIFPSNIVFAGKGIAYAVLLPSTLITISLVNNEIAPTSIVSVVNASLSGLQNVSSYAAWNDANNKTYIYYKYNGSNNLWRLNSDSYTNTPTTIFSVTKGYSGDGGPAGSASVNFLDGYESSPPSFTFDKNGNMYFADIGNTVIRKLTLAPGQLAVDSTSIVSYVAGTPNPSPGIPGDSIPGSAVFNGDTLPFKADA
jgi:hypothetical protein